MNYIEPRVRRLIREIEKEVCKLFFVDSRKIRQVDTSLNVSAARHMIWYMLKNHLLLEEEAIAVHYNVHRATVRIGVKSFSLDGRYVHDREYAYHILTMEHVAILMENL